MTHHQGTLLRQLPRILPIHLHDQVHHPLGLLRLTLQAASNGVAMLQGAGTCIVGVEAGMPCAAKGHSRADNPWF